MHEQHYDWIIIGSGFGGSVSAHRLTQKGYKVLVIEKGRRFKPEDFPKTNWDLKRWMWNPSIGLRGIFKMSFMKHMTVLHGVGVGGGSLVYANTLPTPKSEFFQSGSWSDLADWEAELAPHYETAKRMLGATPNPLMTKGDHVIKEIAKDMGREEHFHPTEVAVFFGEPNKKVPDPFFDGEGPDRVGCNFCGACMTGCRVGAKNTLDQNYLYLGDVRQDAHR
jgi:cholesterol oxidase